MKPYGIIPALITPFTKHRKLDEDGLRSTVKRLMQNGVHGLFCLGTNGEFFALTRQEKIRIVKIVVKEAGGKIPVYAGSGGNSTEETVELTREMEEAGADAVSVITPYFLTLTQKELIFHYRHVAASTSLPILLYNIPGYTGNHLEPSSVAELSREPNIVGIKDSSGSFDSMLQYLDRTDESFAVMSGTDSLIFSALMAGGKGAVASTANFVPNLLVSIYENWKMGDLEGARRAQNSLRPICRSFSLGTPPAILKEALNMLGLPAGPPRRPVAEPGREEKRQLAMFIRYYRDQGWFEAEA